MEPQQADNVPSEKAYNEAIEKGKSDRDAKWILAEYKKTLRQEFARDVEFAREFGRNSLSKKRRLSGWKQPVRCQRLHQPVQRSTIKSKPALALRGIAICMQWTGQLGPQKNPIDEISQIIGGRPAESAPAVQKNGSML